MKDFIPVNSPIFTGNERKYLNECIDSGWVGSDGPFIKRFEDGLSVEFNRDYVSLVSNGSAALEIAVKALGISEGDEVIMPSHTIISCSAAVTKLGAIPVLIDSEKESWNMDVELIEDKINANTKAILAVHTYGFPVKMDKVLFLAKKYNLFVIEDAAEMIGQHYDSQKCGSMGDISIMSFYPNKHITSGEGGAILTNSEELIDKCNYYKNLCFKNPRFVHEELGWNYRISNMQAAVGLAQLEKLNEHVIKKRYIGNLYNELLTPSSSYELQPIELDYSKNIFWVFGILLNKDFGLNAKEIIDKLSESNIGARPFFYPIHKQPVYKNISSMRNTINPVSENLAEYGLYIPSGLALSHNDISQVSEVINSILS